MKFYNTRKLPTKTQYFFSVIFVFAISSICFVFSDFVGYRTVAMILLMLVSVIAMLFEILPVLLAAILSALIWNFFFISPLFTFKIANTEDLLMFLLYFVVALVNAVLTSKIREAEKKARDKEEKGKELKLYNTLLNSLSHELRIPIATILGSVDILKESKDKLTITNQNELLDEITIAGNRLNRQIENILNMSRLESGMLKPKIDWCDMDELVNFVIQKIAVKNEHKIIFQHHENLPLFKLDSGLTEEILYNLLHNSIQHTPANTIIHINVKHENDNCLIIISDNGKGFPVNEMARAFDKFYRLPNTKIGGSGLGLSIVKGFTEAQNGIVKLENNIDSGAKFTIEIPAETTYINILKNE